MTEHDPTVAVTYLRVSTTRQMDTGADVDAEGNSIATQREACNTKAAKLGAVVQQEFVEPGASAQTISKRPVFKQMLTYLEEHPEVGIVVIYVRSRAFRNLSDAVITKRRLEEMGVKLVSSKEDFGEGIMADAMEAVTDIINEVQVRMNGEDIKTKMRHKAERGGTNGRARVGYLNVRIEQDGHQINSIGLDPERAPLVKQAFELYATGDYSLQRLQETMADLGLTTRPTRSRPAGALSMSQVHRMLQDPYYVGLVPYKGETFPGRHEAIITSELFERVQKVVEDRSKPGIRDRVLYHYLKGLLFCSRCHQRGRESRLIYTEANGNGGVYEYFKCRARFNGECDLPYLPAEDVEWKVADHYGTLRLDPAFLTTLRETIEEGLADAQEHTRELHASYTAQLAKLDKQEERLLDLAADGTMPQERIRTRLRDIHLKRAAANEGLTETDEKLELGARHIRRYTDLLEDPAEIYGRASDEARRDLNAGTFERIFVDESGIAGDIKTAIVADLHTASEALNGPERKRLPDVSAGESLSTEASLLADLLRGGWNRGALVREGGLEPPRPKTLEPKSSASANSATRACGSHVTRSLPSAGNPSQRSPVGYGRSSTIVLITSVEVSRWTPGSTPSTSSCSRAYASMSAVRTRSR